MRRSALAGLLLLCAACSTTRTAPDISGLYERIAREGGDQRDPVVVLGAKREMLAAGPETEGMRFRERPRHPP